MWFWSLFPTVSSWFWSLVDGASSVTFINVIGEFFGVKGVVDQFFYGGTKELARAYGPKRLIAVFIVQMLEWFSDYVTIAILIGVGVAIIMYLVLLCFFFAVRQKYPEEANWNQLSFSAQCWLCIKILLFANWNVISLPLSLSKKAFVLYMRLQRLEELEERDQRTRLGAAGRMMILPGEDLDDEH